MMSDTQRQISLLFKPDEWVCVSTDAFGTTPVSPERIVPIYAYFSVNPLKRHTRRADKNVSSYRNFLIEFDEGSIEEQRKYVVELGMPYTTCVFSGSKSLHFVIGLDEGVSEEAWRKHMRALLAAVPKADKATSNPSRFSRLAGHYRDSTSKFQALVDYRHPISEKELVEFFTKRQVDLDSLTPSQVKQRVSELKLPLPPRTMYFLRFGAIPQHSHYEAILSAHNMRDCGYNEVEAVELLKKAPWPSAEKGEIERIVFHAFNSGCELCPE